MQNSMKESQAFLIPTRFLRDLEKTANFFIPRDFGTLQHEGGKNRMTPNFREEVDMTKKIEGRSSHARFTM